MTPTSPFSVGQGLRFLPGLVALVIAALTLGSAAMLWGRGTGLTGLGPSDWAAVRFTLTQAALSAVVSCLLAVPLARALFRRRFYGRNALIALLGAPFVLPVLVAVLGLLAIFGRAGPVNLGLTALNLPPVSIFGLQGVVLAHVFLNLPFATRMLLMSWQEIPAERFRLAASLSMGPRAMAWHLERPMLVRVLPGAFLAVFLICLTSFAVALTLGGGPRASTVELLIYQALRFEFDLSRAAKLAGLQFGLCAAVTLLVARAAFPFLHDAGRGAALTDLAFAPEGWRRLGDGAVIAMAVLFLGLPLLAVIWRGVPGLADLPQGTTLAALRSVLVALASAGLCVTLALTLSLAIAARGPGHRLLEIAGMLPLATSALVLGTGLFLMTRPWAPDSLALPVTVLVNAVLTLPFLIRLLLPPARRVTADYARLAGSLGLTGGAALRVLYLPRLRRPLAFGAGLAAALSMGDLGVIALFASERTQTLPLLASRLMGAYQMQAAAAVALVLVALSFALFALLDALGARDVDA